MHVRTCIARFLVIPDADAPILDMYRATTVAVRSVYPEMVWLDL
jgi:hypothetical protein